MKKIYFLGFILIILDQITKFLIRDKSIEITNFFSLEYVTNTGSLFGLFKGNNLVFILIGLIILILITVWFIREKNNKLNLGLIFLISGIAGNLIDRIIYGNVIDFINFKFWYVFNFADVYILAGIFLVIYTSRKITRT
ncbi:MAG: signal peptidase II [Candidatus Nanoarchaeia archaeon]|nr:signal peptidase II [Candidatus Nanoarchaeia archaeon]